MKLLHRDCQVDSPHYFEHFPHSVFFSLQVAGPGHGVSLHHLNVRRTADTWRDLASWHLSYVECVDISPTIGRAVGQFKWQLRNNTKPQTNARIDAYRKSISVATVYPGCSVYFRSLLGLFVSLVACTLACDAFGPPQKTKMSAVRHTDVTMPIRSMYA